MLRRLAVIASLLFVLAATGCLQPCYLLQAIAGQDELVARARPIEQVLDDTSVPLRTRAVLRLVADVKRFGEVHGLRPTDNYEEYSALDRPAAVWVVNASEPLRHAPSSWWFPVVGSVPYLGWFNRSHAIQFADDLRDRGYDVYLRGASAYSTLGWFADPVLSSMIHEGETLVGDLVNVVLHESVHATKYVESQSVFNESLAAFVADRLTLRYLRERLRADRWQLYEYQEKHAQRAHRALRYHQTYEQLDELYNSALSKGDKLAEKRRVVEALRIELRREGPINNAVLAQSRTYRSASPELASLLKHCGSDWRRFWVVVARLESSAFTAPQQNDLAPVLAPLIRADCPAAVP